MATSLRTYNLAQLHVVEHPAAEDVLAHASILSAATLLPGTEDRFADAEAKRSFQFDHVQFAISEFEAYELPEEEEKFRAELFKSLVSYTKNHYSTGFASVACSQRPLLPPAPAEPEPEPTPETETVPVQVAEPEAESEPTENTPPVPESTDTLAEPITDIVQEQVGAGDAEPVPTPAVGDVEQKTEEVVEPGGLEKVDELMEEAKESEEVKETQEKAAAETSDGAPQLDEPMVEESKTEEEPQIDLHTATPAPVERKQERIDNPIYTLETVGNRFNPNNFW
jgi:capping protein alpha